MMTTGEQRLGIILVFGLLAVQALIATTALRTEVAGAWALCIRIALVAALIVETIVLWKLLRANRSALAYAVAFGGIVVVSLLALPLVLSW